MVFNTFGPIAFAVELSHGWSDTTLAMMAAVGSASFIGRIQPYCSWKNLFTSLLISPQPPSCLYCGSCRARTCETLCCLTLSSSWDANFANRHFLKVYIKLTHHCGIQYVWDNLYTSGASGTLGYVILNWRSSTWSACDGHTRRDDRERRLHRPLLPLRRPQRRRRRPRHVRASLGHRIRVGSD